jgi:hypothetical protein
LTGNVAELNNPAVCRFSRGKYSAWQGNVTTVVAVPLHHQLIVTVAGSDVFNQGHHALKLIAVALMFLATATLTKMLAAGSASISSSQLRQRTMTFIANLRSQSDLGLAEVERNFRFPNQPSQLVPGVFKVQGLTSDNDNYRFDITNAKTYRVQALFIEKRGGKTHCILKFDEFKKALEAMGYDSTRFRGRISPEPSWNFSRSPFSILSINSVPDKKQDVACVRVLVVETGGKPA